MRAKDRRQSVWEFELSHFPTLTKNIEVENCIIGGGVSGVSIAYQMAKRGQKVTLIEAFSISSGQTVRTTAHLTNQLEEQFLNLRKIHDNETISLILEAQKKAIDEIEKIVESENISSDFKRVDGYLFEGKNFDKDNLRNEQFAAQECGLDLDWVEVTPYLTDSKSSLRFRMQAQFNPLKYVEGLIRVLKDLNVSIYEGTHINDITQEDRGHWLLLSDQGYQIRCKNLIVATDTPINNRFHIHTKQAAYRTYVMSFKLNGHIKEECLLWDTETPYHYIRFTGDLLIVGGEDHRTGQMPEEDPFVKLELWARENFHFISEVVDKWSGQVFEPVDHVAFIGRNPGLDQNVYIATGYSGNGMTNATIASLMIPDLVEKNHHPWEKLFDPSRSFRKSIKEYIKENSNTAFQYRDWLTSSEVVAIEEIPRDRGSVIRNGMVKECVYHDDQDHFQKNRAVCTHLGGIVRWNDIEKTWDCPCHGSRFNTQGKVIEGPALSNLMEH